MQCTAGFGFVAHDATAEAMLTVVLLRAHYEDRPWGWTRNEMSLIVIDLESVLTAPCVLSIRACHHHLLFMSLVNQGIQLGVSVDFFMSDHDWMSEVTHQCWFSSKCFTFKRMLKVLVSSGAAWVDLAMSMSI